MNDSDKESIQKPLTKEHQKPTPTKETPVPLHLRRRYWSSREELKLVELWRRYSTEVTNTVKNLPIYKTISVEMRACGFQVGSQECRRKINNLKNKYITERRQLETSGGDAESDWKLYPLIHCLLMPKSNNFDTHHEENIVKQFIAKLPPLPGATQSSLTSNGLPRSTPFATSTPNSYKRSYVSSTTTTTTTSTSIAWNGVQKSHAPYKTANDAEFRLRHRFKIPRLEDLQRDNIRLAEGRDYALKRLCIEEREVQMLEQIVQSLQCCRE